MSSDSCTDIYNDARDTFDTGLACTMIGWLFFSVAFIPKNEAREQRSQRQRWCGTCLRSMTFCFEPCRPLLGQDQTRVVAAMRNAGTCCSVAFVLLFLLLQMVPSVALVVGLVYFYPECKCSDTEYCQKCIFKFDFIPIGSCTGVTVFFCVIVSLASLAFASKAVRALGTIRNAASYTMAGAMEQELV
eukprot:CAMPEP_0171325994 /NCGR_PEP_ID=MMETSP0816-20121228/117159_1 /TAXON_ID=420281 /ORGANISM="Proboscia inermis, Strain CCAP1064/1" /LENGTH=187 /DNA_ID=CAMNT_0011825315 /DNA_START=258 /DNA_END=821 /DNA_ORIENTATION=+